MKVLLALLLPALLLLATTAGADPLPGFDRLTVDAPHRPRPLQAAIWYPAGSTTYTAAVGANPLFTGTMVQLGTAVAPGPHPLVVLVHGSGGNIENLGWLAEGLVAQGAIVVGVNHPGATSGDSSPRQLPYILHRTLDVAALLATLRADPTFGPALDPGQISLLGFSLGGATALAAGGARFDAAAFAAYCDRYGKDASECNFMAMGGADPHALPPEFSADMTVPGLARIIAIDPALSHALVETSLATLPPTHLIKLGDGADLVPPARDIGPMGSNLAARIPGASFTNITPGWHFSFLGLCNPGAEAMLKAEGEDPICSDPKGSDRATVHRQVIADVAAAIGL
jgi:predicted dienelactone hydrolase